MKNLKQKLIEVNELTLELKEVINVISIHGLEPSNYKPGSKLREKVNELLNKLKQ